ncbi:hypothetical protein Lepto7376_1643 [[Leptolyngbya] sp. PCC 7376]|uniref:DUF5357 family protein n=1 Tax=[Leptolyngbya] sp. PCC 7376 TaxID=111781 RepID=UPI00029F2D55|nr:DUF5357 family protein [[Leptolyngbya] sp. PCC 7376]AFY37977.1 hypothetical protein Lepto7376_1643 [[Leptolyngbya] sp. PCC 7376]
MGKKLKELFEKYRPKRWYSWQTTIWLSGISGLMSILATLIGQENSIVAEFLASCGWMFLIVGISWVVKEERSTLAPWITAAVITVFIFGSWEIGSWSTAIIIWPVISAIIYALPYFWNESLQKKLPNTKERIRIFLILGSQLLLSFWIQFYLVLSDFIVEYPSLYSDDLSESLFVVRTPNRSAQDPRGVFILDLLDVEIQEHYANRLWAEVDQELEQENILVPTILQLFEQVENKTARLKEDKDWLLLDPYTNPKGEGSQELVLQYDWRGSQAKDDEDYRVEKLCTFQPIPSPPPLISNVLVTQVECSPSKVFGWLSDLKSDGQSG